MTNLDWLKKAWIWKIQELSEEEVYEMLTDGTVQSGICKYCERIFPQCEDTLNNDDICRNRFKIWCGMTHQQKEAKVYV